MSTLPHIRILTNIAVACIAMLLLPTSARSTDSTSTNTALFKAFDIGGFSERDLSMPADYYADDPQRKRIVKHLFEHPLSLHAEAATIKDSAVASVRATFAKSLQLLDRTSDIPTFGNVVMSAKDLDSLLGVRLDTICNNAESALLRRSLSQLVKLANKTARARQTIDSVHLDAVLSKADSLLLNSEDGPSDIYTSRQAQREALESVRTYFQLVDSAMDTLDDMYGIGMAAYEHAAIIAEQTSALDSADLRLISNHEFETPYGRVAIGGLESNVYWGDYFLIVDVGGDDVYMHGDHDKHEAARHPIRMVLDLAGNDRYAGGDFAVASAVLGTSIIIDRQGNDSYAGRDFSVGSALFGLAILHDMSGNDTYNGRTCTQGAGAFGIAILQDDNGNDVYRAASQGQAFGFSEGAGWLVDKQGSDTYITASPFVDYLRYSDHFVAFTQGASLGFRPIASGGFGLLVDAAGADTYITDIFGQSTSYWYGMSVLYDCSGNDRYQAYQYAQGSGVHLAHAILIDSAGDDHYFSHGVSQGCGHDVATGILYDYSGDDEYIAESLSQGAGNADAVSILADGMGDDVYVSRNQGNTQGFSDFRRDFGMFGVLADVDGNNIIGTQQTREQLKSTWGVAYIQNGEVEIAVNNAAAASNSSPEVQLTASADSLFIQASAAPFSVQHNVEPARDSLVALRAEGLYYVAQYMNTELARERHAVEAILRKYYDTDTAAITRLLKDSIHSPNSRTASMARRVAGRLRVDATVGDLLQHIRDTSWHVRSSCVLTIGKIKPDSVDNKLVKTIVDAVQDSSYMVRKRASFSSGVFWRELSQRQLNALVNNSEFNVRAHFAEGIVRSKDTLSVADVKMLLHVPTSESARATIVAAFVHIEQSEAMKELLLTSVPRYSKRIKRHCIAALKRASRSNEYFNDVLHQFD